MKFTPTALPEVVLVQPDVFRDARGFFLESYHQRKYREAGISVDFIQDNHSLSIRSALRGLHFQFKHPQGKLIRVLSGEIYDVAVDIRVGSPRFKQWVSVTLSAENFHQLYVPPGFAHGFIVLSEKAEVEYKCSDFYNASDEGGIIWNDAEIGVRWPASQPILSSKDQALPSMRELMDRLPRYKG